MDLKRFELIMKSFFNKAGVKLLRKNFDYDAYGDEASYILLDEKRKSFYLAEADRFDEILKDMELDALASWVAEKEQLPLDGAKAAMKLGKAVKGYKESYTLTGVDIGSLSRKSALIIREENSGILRKWLEGKGVACQSAALKGAFLVLFLDKGSSEHLGDIYAAMSDEYMESLAAGDDTPSFDDIMSSVPADDDLSANVKGSQKAVSFDDIMSSVPADDDLSANVKGSQKAVSFDDIMSSVPADDELSANVKGSQKAVSFDDIMSSVPADDELSANVKGSQKAVSFDDIMSSVPADDDLSANVKGGQKAVSFDDIMSSVPADDDLSANVKGSQKAVSFDDIMSSVPADDELSASSVKAATDKGASSLQGQGGKATDESLLREAALHGATVDSDGKATAIDDDNQDKLLDELDLSFISKKREEEPEDSELLYSKIINEKAQSAADAPSPRAGNAGELPKDIADFLDEDATGDANADSVSAAESESSNDEAVKAKPAKKAKEAKAPKAPKDWGQIINCFWNNLSAFIFFAPSYLLNKVTRRVLPPFIIYWLGAIVVFFGLYQWAFSFISPLFYPELTEFAGSASSYINTVFSDLTPSSPAENGAYNMLLSSAVFFSGQIGAAAVAEGGFLLKYLMSFGALLMVFPCFRATGGRLCIFSVLFFIAVPFILWVEGSILQSLAEGVSQWDGTGNYLSMAASAAITTVCVVPVAAIGAVYWLGRFYVPCKEKCSKEVLP